MPEDQSVSMWVKGVSERDDDAARALWDRYFGQLVNLARNKLGKNPRVGFDEEDVALSAMNSFFHRAADGRFPDLEDRVSLWRVLVTIVVAKVRTRQRRQMTLKRGGRRVHNESEFSSSEIGGLQKIEHILAKTPTPDVVVELSETRAYLIEQLADPALQRVAQLRLDGFTNEEIATDIGRSVSTVERRLTRIRNKWADSCDRWEPGNDRPATDGHAPSPEH